VRPAALVTGSAKGIGRRLLLALAEDGFDVVVHYRGSEAEAHDVAAEARAFGVQAEVAQADVTVESEAW
jgi:NAD(P)-dependent dehydrogenase (short-subunit alcohol dehydrogenase family)